MNGAIPSLLHRNHSQGHKKSSSNEHDKTANQISQWNFQPNSNERKVSACHTQANTPVHFYRHIYKIASSALSLTMHDQIKRMCFAVCALHVRVAIYNGTCLNQKLSPRTCNICLRKRQTVIEAGRSDRKSGRTEVIAELITTKCFLEPSVKTLLIFRGL